mmetsp:Transcript_14786/g.34204  ORF Transcript_14786/g.34204 Transcript_14786/m.34204 type:complete len:308 (-) Transcript_14786:412-1335(-)
MEIDHRDSLELIKLTEVGHLLPFLGNHALHNINGHGRNVFIGDNLFPASQEQVLDRFAIGFIDNDFLDWRFHDNLSTSSFDVFLHRSTESVGLVTVQKCHLQSVVLVQETVHGGQDNGHRQLIRIDEIQGFGHRNEDLSVDALGHTILSHEIRDTELILRIDKGLSFDQHRQKRRGGLDFFSQGQHFLVKQNGQTEVEGSWDSWDEVKGCEFTGQFLHGEDHLVNLPLQTIMNVEFVEQIHHVGVGSKENVQTSFDPITVLVLPRRHFSTQNIPGLVDNRFVTGIRQILGTGQSRETSSDDSNLLLL